MNSAIFVEVTLRDPKNHETHYLTDPMLQEMGGPEAQKHTEVRIRLHGPSL